MNETEKSRIRLAHWKDHNADHIKGYEEVARTLEELGVPDAPEMIRKGISLVEAANAEFERALQALGSACPASEPPAAAEDCGAHDHSHTHEHCHHDGHSHDHEHDHHHGLQHEHCGRHQHTPSQAEPHAPSDKPRSE